jgi:hypothetical protein
MLKKYFEFTSLVALTFFISIFSAKARAGVPANIEIQAFLSGTATVRGFPQSLPIEGIMNFSLNWDTKKSGEEVWRLSYEMLKVYGNGTSEGRCALSSQHLSYKTSNNANFHQSLRHLTPDSFSINIVSGRETIDLDLKQKNSAWVIQGVCKSSFEKGSTELSISNLVEPFKTECNFLPVK